MDGPRLGTIARAIRIRKALRQSDLARLARVSRDDVSRLERGLGHELRVEVLARIFQALGGRLDLVPRWQGGDLDRLLNARHAAMHESVARWFLGLPGWEIAPEVSFAIRGERGVVDILAWHAGTRTLLVIELKTEIVDISELMGTVHRKQRLATEIARERGWVPAAVGVWLLVADSATNRRRVARHSTSLRAAFPSDGRMIRGWLADPHGTVACLSFWSDAAHTRTKDGLATAKRVRRQRDAAA
jgi:transcriptional regulator with XRE-family HTH domain